MTRTVPKGLAPILENLELNQPRIVTLEQIACIVDEVNLRAPPALIAYRLRERGWLLDTGLRGAWEFAPAANAGPQSRGGPLLPLLAALALRPGLPAAVALGSAAWAHGLVDRAPRPLELAVIPDSSLPAGLKRRARIVLFKSRLDPVRKRGVPVQRLETLLVHMAARPLHVASWGAAAEWLSDVAAEAEQAGISQELEDRPRAVRIRLAYLVAGVWPDLAERLGDGVRSTVWFGPRKKLRRHSQKWHVADSLLPFDPSRLPPVRDT